jgi:hypothetical protein
MARQLRVEISAVVTIDGDEYQGDEDDLGPDLAYDLEQGTVRPGLDISDVNVWYVMEKGRGGEPA